MANQIPEQRIRRMLFEFCTGSNATVATKKICKVYPSALDVHKCQRWFSKFRSGSFNLSDSYRSGRPTSLDNNMLRVEVEANPCQTMEELSNTLNQLWSRNIYSRLKNIIRAGVWVSTICPKRNKPTNPSYAMNCFNSTLQNFFFLSFDHWR